MINCGPCFRKERAIIQLGMSQEGMITFKKLQLQMFNVAKLKQFGLLSYLLCREINPIVRTFLYNICTSNPISYVVPISVSTRSRKNARSCIFPTSIYYRCKKNMISPIFPPLMYVLVWDRKNMRSSIFPPLICRGRKKVRSPIFPTLSFNLLNCK